MCPRNVPLCVPRSGDAHAGSPAYGDRTGEARPEPQTASSYARTFGGSTVDQQDGATKCDDRPDAVTLTKQTTTHAIEQGVDDLFDFDIELTDDDIGA